MNYYHTLPLFLGYFSAAVILLGVFVLSYILITPHNELDLIRRGNVSAAAQLTGSILGFALPLAAIITHSVNLLDVCLWGVVAAIVQVLTFFLTVRWIQGGSRYIADNNIGAGVTIGGISLAVGVLQAACLIP